MGSAACLHKWVGNIWYFQAFTSTNAWFSIGTLLTNQEHSVYHFLQGNINSTKLQCIASAGICLHLLLRPETKTPAGKYQKIDCMIGWPPFLNTDHLISLMFQRLVGCREVWFMTHTKQMQSSLFPNLKLPLSPVQSSWKNISPIPWRKSARRAVWHLKRRS